MRQIKKTQKQGIDNPANYKKKKLENNGKGYFHN